LQDSGFPGFRRNDGSEARRSVSCLCNIQYT
jgi:hypothetical protein